MYGSTNGKESSKIKKKNSKNDDYLASYSTKNKNVKEHMKPATRQQYRKYLDDSENTFYENSYNGIVLSVISCVRPLLISSFSFLILFYGVLSFV